MPERDEDHHYGRFSIIPSAAVDDPRMTLALLKLLNVMGTYGNKDGYCWPKLATLATRLGDVTKSAVSQNLKKLNQFGYLEIAPRFDAGGGRTTNMYRILYDTPRPELNGGLAPELNGGLAPELNGGLAPELNTLNVPSERTRLTLPSAAAISLSTREQVNGAMPEAAAADDEKALYQTAEACRKHLRMQHDKLAGLKLIVRCYPGRRAWLENQANLCFSTLKVRPLELNHFSNWLDIAEQRRLAAREGELHGERAHETHAPPATARSDVDDANPEELAAAWAEIDALVARTVGKEPAG